ncbi:hypothetical protein [Actinospongicola halichondriae]|uniref:hypothetical protein n=1 Tax=Actinospongicola halichondriae TaxID=3236844 RepID=UPI003D53B0CB
MIRNAAIAGAVALGAVGVGVGWTVQQNVFADDAVGGTVGAPAGVDLDGDGVISDDERITPSAIYFDCPGGEALGELHDGDRILTVGIHDTADGWLALRKPLEPSETVWIAAEQVVPDGETGDLPAMPCAEGEALQIAGPDEIEDDPDTTEVAAPDETTTTRPTSETTQTSKPSTTATTKPNATTTTKPKSTTTTTTTTVPAPALSLLAPSPSAISELRGDGNACAEGGPTAKTSLVRATTTNADSVTMSWSVAGNEGQKNMSETSSDFWQVVLGSFGQSTISSGTATINVTVRATGPGGTTTKNTTVTLHNCGFFG